MAAGESPIHPFFDPGRTGLPRGLNVVFRRNFLPDPDRLLGPLRDELCFSEVVSTYAHGRPFPRLLAAQGDDETLAYRFAGATVRAMPWTPTVLRIRDAVREAVPGSGGPLNFCLANLYRDGRDGIGRHRDDESDLVPDGSVACVSLGETRTLYFSRPGCPRVRYVLPSGSLYVMHPPTNEYWYHEIPRDPDGKAGGARISLTFRTVVGGGERERRGPSAESHARKLS